MNAVLRHLRRLVAIEESRDHPDQELLQRFTSANDEMAFSTLVERHAPTVLGVGRRVLQHEQDAEDVLQATFLVLVRKATSIRRGASVGSWLHGVAYRLARKVRARKAREHQRQRVLAQSLQESQNEPPWREEQAVLEAELQRLPDKYRAPIVLCCLRGLSRDEAARELGWSLRAVKIRLERGRELLRQRLAQRGITLSATLLTTFLAEKAALASVPVRLVAGTVQMGVQWASGQALHTVASASVAALVGEMLRGVLLFHLLRLGTAALVLIVVLGAGVGWYHWAGSETQENASPQPLVAAEGLLVRPTEQPEIPAILPASAPAEERRPPEPVTAPGLVGIVRKSPTSAQTLTVRIREKEYEYPLSPTVRVRIDGQEARLADLRPSWRVRLTLVPNGKEIVTITTEGRVVTTTLLSVNVLARTITVSGAWRQQYSTTRVVSGAAGHHPECRSARGSGPVAGERECADRTVR